MATRKKAKLRFIDLFHHLQSTKQSFTIYAPTAQALDSYNLKHHAIVHLPFLPAQLLLIYQRAADSDQSIFMHLVISITSIEKESQSSIDNLLAFGGKPCVANHSSRALSSTSKLFDNVEIIRYVIKAPRMQNSAAL